MLTIEEGDELLASALGAQGEGDGGETVDGIETEQNIVVLPRSREQGSANYRGSNWWRMRTRGREGWKRRDGKNARMSSSGIGSSLGSGIKWPAEATERPETRRSRQGAWQGESSSNWA